jgi:hypothetical protein
MDDKKDDALHHFNHRLESVEEGCLVTCGGVIAGRGAKTAFFNIMTKFHAQVDQLLVPLKEGESEESRRANFTEGFKNVLMDMKYDCPQPDEFHEVGYNKAIDTTIEALPDIISGIEI